MSENEKLVEAVNKIFDTLLDDAHDVDLKNVWLLIGPCDKARQAVLRALASSPASAQSAAVGTEGWKLTYDSAGDCVYFTAPNNREANAIEMNGGVVWRFARDTGEFVGVMLYETPTCLPAAMLAAAPASDVQN